MRLKNEEIGLFLEVDNALLDKLIKHGRNHYPKEFGGVLVGNYSPNRKTVNIIDTLLPVSYKSSKFSFERGSEGLKERLIGLFDANPPLIYVGEWHTHPDARPLPSGTDVKGMLEIANHQDVNIASPLLLIIGLTPDTSELGFYVHFNKNIYKYETV